MQLVAHRPQMPQPNQSISLEKKKLQAFSFWSFHCFLNVEAMAQSVSDFTEEKKKIKGQPEE